MDYKLKIGEEKIPVEVTTSDDATLHFTINDSAYDVAYHYIDDNHIHISMNGKRINAYFASGDTGKTITIAGNRFFIEDADALELTKKSGKSGADLPDVVTPPMPAIVIQVLVKEGEAVVKGQGLVVVSAMKMETTLFAPFDGSVRKINTGEGEKVNPGDILIDIEKNESVEAEVA